MLSTGCVAGSPFAMFSVLKLVCAALMALVLTDVGAGMLPRSDLEPTNRRPLQPAPKKAPVPLLLTFKSREGLTAYIERRRENESFSDLFARLEETRRDRRARIADAALRELRRSARALQREILWRKVVSAVRKLTGRFADPTSDN